MNYTLNINIINLDGETIHQAKVSILQLKSGKEKPVTFSRDPGCYIATDMELGRVLIKVESKGYDSQKRYHAILGPNESELIVMGEINSKYILINSGKHPIRDFNEEIAIIAPKQQDHNSFLSDTTKRSTSLKLNSEAYSWDEVNTKSESIYFINTTQKAAKTQRTNQLLGELRRSSPVSAVGPVIQKNGDEIAILHNSCSVIFYADTDTRTIEKILSGIGASHWEPTGVEHHVYDVTFSEELGWELLNLAQKLSLIPEVQSISNSVIRTAPKPSAAIDPNVFHWPSQWDKQLMKVGEAWQDILENEGPALKYGNTATVIAVLDDGTETSSGDATNPDLNGYTDDGVQATLTNAMTPPSAVIAVENATGFSAGHKISLGGQLEVEIISVSTNQLTTTAIANHVRKGVEVFNKSVANVSSFLTADLSKTQSVIATTITTGSFKVGQEVTIRDFTDTDWEAVIIESIDPSGTVLTTSPIKNTHPANTVIRQGRKLVRAIDFSKTTAVDVLNNNNPESSHGTAVATLIASRAENNLGIAGTAPNVRIVAALRLSANFSGEKSFQWISGSKSDTYIVALNKLNEVGAVNSSIAWGDYDANITDAVKIAFDSIIRNTRNRKGITIVLTAGNDKRNIGKRWNGLEKVINVSASYYQVYSDLISYREQRASYSNFSDTDTTPDVRVSVCAPSRGATRFEAETPPAYLGIYAGDLLGKGNIIDKSDDPTPAEITTATIVPESTLRVAISGTQNHLEIDNSIPAGTFPNGSWLKIGDIYPFEWVQVDQEDFSNPTNKKILLLTPTTKNHVIGTYIGLLPAYTTISRSIVPNSVIISVESAKGFKTDDWILMGQHPEEMKWIEIDSVDTTSTQNTITIKSAYKNTDVIQFFGPDVNRDVVSYSALSTGSNYIDINVAYANRDNYVKVGTAIEVTSAGGQKKWYTIKEILSGATGGPYIPTRLSLDSPLTASVTSGAAVHIPKSTSIIRLLQGSSVIQLNSYTGFSSNTWIHLDTPGNIGDASTPRVEPVYVHTVESTGLRISGPINSFSLGTQVHRSSQVNFQNRMGGTSAAAPQVTGAVALMLAVNPKLTWMEIREILKETAVQIDPTNKGFPAVSPPNPSQPVGLGRWKNKAGQYIIQKDGELNPGLPVPGVTDQTPYYSDWFGHGRIDVLAAVQETRYSIEYGPDLMLRNYMLVNSDGTTIEDDGVTEVDLNNFKIDSPDIWLRRGFVASGDSESASINRSELPPHQTFDITSDNSIYIRVINRSPEGGKNSYQAWVRVYLALTAGEFDLGFLSSFNDSESNIGYTAGKTGIFYLGDVDSSNSANDPGGELKLYNRPLGYIGNDKALDDTGGIEPQKSYTVLTKWKNSLKPVVGTHKRTYIVAEVLPHDGQLSEPYVGKNNNISYKRVLFSDVKIREVVGATESAWPEFVQHEGTDIVKNFKITLFDWEYLIAKHIQIRVSRISLFDVEESVTLSYDGSSWSTDTSIPELTISTTPTIIAGSPDKYVFIGTITYRATDYSHKIEAILLEPDVAEQEHHNPVKPLVERYVESIETTVISIPVPGEDAGSGLSPAIKPRIHVFTDMDKLKSQDPTDDVDNRFIPDSSDPEHSHHITTLFKGLNPGDTINAYSVMSGRVFVQQDQDNPDKVNLFLKPIVQSGLGFTPVKYFVYRGLKTSDFLQGTSSPDNTIVAPESGSTEFIQSLYTNLANRNAETDPVGTDTLSPLAFGWNPSGQTDPQRSIDDFFFNPDGNNQFQIVPQGMILGTFKNDTSSDDFGFEIVLEDGLFIPTLVYARKSKFTLEIDATIGIFEQRAEREAILSFIDPAAFFGMHEFAGVQSPGGLIPPTDVYSDILEKFLNKHHLYLDIRNENNYSYNYYRNHIIEQETSPDTILPDKDYVSFSLAFNHSDTFKKFGFDTHYWPYFRIPGGSISSGNYGVIYLKLKTGDENPNPVVYSWNGIIITPKSNERFVDGDKIQVAGEPATKKIGFILPKIDLGSENSSNNSFEFKASMIKLSLLRKIPSGVDSGNRVLPTENFHDNVFGPLETILQKRLITAVNPGSKTFIISGDYTNSVSNGDVVEVTKATDSGNNQVYTVLSVSLNGSNQTEIVVNESFTGSSAPYGEICFSNHLWKTSLPTKWFSGTKRTFIDTSTIPADSSAPLFGFSYMGNTGVAIDDGRIIFFATPHHYLLRAENRTVNQLNLTGGIGPSDSFWVEIAKNTPTLSISATVLKLSTIHFIPIFEFEQTDIDGGAPKNENFLALCFTDSEFNQIKRAIFQSELHPVHDIYLRLKNPITNTDLNGVSYLTHEIWLVGWKIIPGDEFDPENVVYHEVSSAYSTGVNPVLVYSSAANGLIFSSADYADVEITESKHTPADEQLRSESGAISILASNPGIAGLVSNFQSSLSGITNDNTALQTLVEDAGRDLFEQIITSTTPYDSRPLYWSQMNIKASMREHEWLKKQKKLVRVLLSRFEEKSRGLSLVNFTNSNPAFSSVNFSSAKKIVVIGFDPTNLDPKIGGNVETRSIGGTLVVSMHNEVITHSGHTGVIQSVIFPIRYDDYKGATYRSFLKNLLNPTGTESVEMIVILGENSRKNYLDVEWLAAKKRNGHPDNRGKTIKHTQGFGKDRFLATTLPVNKMVNTGINPRIYFNQSYNSSTGTVNHPADGGPDNNVIPGTTPDGQPNSGSSVPFIYNEVFYVLQSERNQLNSTCASGMISIPQTGTTWTNIDTIRNSVLDAFKRSLEAI